jgi:predicted CxxxxCH...CXXCH cytochrome family protein
VLPTSTGHSNGTAEISFGPLARTGGASPSWNGTTCSNVYCHGSFTGGKVYAPTWTAPVTSTCGTCHGLPPVAPHPQNADCSACHTPAGWALAATARGGAAPPGQLARRLRAWSLAAACTGLGATRGGAARALLAAVAMAPGVFAQTVSTLAGSGTGEFADGIGTAASFF